MPALGSVLMRTACRLLAGLSLASLKPKSAAEKVLLPSSSTVSVALWPAGASLTCVTVMVVAPTLESAAPSLTLTVMLRAVVSGVSLVLLNLIARRAVW